MSVFYIHSFNAQDKNGGKEKIKALKIAYFTEELKLTTKEAQEFWPLYNKYDKKQRELKYSYRTVIRKISKENGSIDNITEAQAKNTIALKLKVDKQLYDEKNDFMKKLENILTFKKIVKLQIAEMEFGRKLMRKYKHKEKK